MSTLMSQRFRSQPDQIPYERLFRTFGRAFRPDLPLWKQYYYYLYSLVHGDLGTSIVLYPAPVFHVIARSAPYTLGLLIPAVALSWLAGTKLGAMAAQKKRLDNTVLPISYALAACPYMWLAAIMSWLFAFVLGIFPTTAAYDATISKQWSIAFALNILKHWFLPFATLFLVAFGVWVIGMRSMIVHELDADYLRYLDTLGAPDKLKRKYAYRNALLPQISGLALQLGGVMGGAIVTEIIFAYPGIGDLLFRGLMSRDYFLVQGIFLFVIVGIVITSFVADIVYVIMDPRVRIGMQGGRA